MSPEERMTIDEQRKYLHKMRIRYWQAEGRSERGRLLDEMQAVPSPQVPLFYHLPKGADSFGNIFF